MPAPRASSCLSREKPRGRPVRGGRLLRASEYGTLGGQLRKELREERREEFREDFRPTPRATNYSCPRPLGKSKQLILCLM